MNHELLIVGEVLTDAFPDGEVSGGAPYNVARNLGFLGQHALMISRTGEDAIGQRIRREMQQIPLTTAGLQTDSVLPTGRVNVEFDVHTHNHRFHILREQAYDSIDASAALQAYRDWRNDGARTILCCGTLIQREVTSRQALHSLLAEIKPLVFLDVNLREGQYDAATVLASMQFADIVKLNQDEWHYLRSLLSKQNKVSEGDVRTQDKQDNRMPERAALQQMLTHFELQALIVTLGADGYCYADRQGNFLSSGDIRHEMVLADTVGAGDAFSAIFLLGLMQGWPLPQTLERAHAFAGAMCGIRGAVGDAAFYAQWKQRWQLDHRHQQESLHV